MDVSRRGWLGLAGTAAVASTTLNTGASATTIRPMVADPTGFAPAPGIAHLKYNENPLGPPASAIQAMAELARSSWYYADDAEARLAAMIGKRLGVPASQVVLGHGSSEVITSAALAWGKRGKCGAELTVGHDHREKFERVLRGVRDHRVGTPLIRCQDVCGANRQA